jgi:hypothetical protein
VAVKRNELGAVVYEDVYAFGNKDATAEAAYMRLTLANATATTGNRTLELTPLHFTPVMAAGSTHWPLRFRIILNNSIYSNCESWSLESQKLTL